jgi:hypothetical protein
MVKGPDGAGHHVSMLARASSKLLYCSALLYLCSIVSYSSVDGRSRYFESRLEYQEFIVISDRPCQRMS